MKARKRDPGDDAPAIETRNEPSGGILPGRTHQKGTNETGMRQVGEIAAKAAAVQRDWFSTGQWLDDIQAAMDEVLAPLRAHNAAMEELFAKKSQGTLTPADKQHAIDLRRAREHPVA
jgi:hypothetical protein